MKISKENLLQLCKKFMLNGVEISAEDAAMDKEDFATSLSAHGILQIGKTIKEFEIFTESGWVRCYAESIA